MAIKKVEIQDHIGNVYYPHTKADVVFMENGQSVQKVVGEGLTASNVKMSDGTSVEEAINGQRLKAISLHNRLDKIF